MGIDQRITPIPNPPVLGTDTFESDMYDFHEAEKDMGTELNQMAEEINATQVSMNATAVAANASALAAAVSEANAAVSAQVADQAANFKGEWSSAVTYAKNETVLHTGMYYYAKLPSTNKNPSSETAYWGLRPPSAVVSGGTGLTNLPAGRIPYGAGTSPFANVDRFIYDESTGVKIFRYGKKVIYHSAYVYTVDNQNANIYATITPSYNSYLSAIVVARFFGVQSASGSHSVVEIKFRIKKWTTGAPEVELLEASRRSGIMVFCVPQIDGNDIRVIARKTTTGATWFYGRMTLEIEGTSQNSWNVDNFIPPVVIMAGAAPSSVATYEDITGQYFQSNVGIGSINPQAPVHAVSATGRQLRLEGAGGATVDFEASSKYLSIDKDLAQPSFRYISTAATVKTGVPSTYNLIITLSSASQTAVIGGKFSGVLSDSLSYLYKHFFSFDFLIQKLTTENVLCSVGNLSQINGTAPTISSISVSANDDRSVTITVTMTDTVFGSLTVSKGVIMAHETSGSISSAEWE